jgi:hypothetical protein
MPFDDPAVLVAMVRNLMVAELERDRSLELRAVAVALHEGAAALRAEAEQVLLQRARVASRVSARSSALPGSAL